MGEGNVLKNDEFSKIQSVDSTDKVIRVTTTGDTGRPVVSVFELIESQWVLIDVVLEMR